LPDGHVLLAGGYNSTSLASAEIYDVGLNFTNSSMPTIISVTSPLCPGSSVAVTGALFRGVGEASTGNSQDSSADYPLVQLRSLESGRTLYLLSTNLGANYFASLPVLGFPPGYALVTVFVNGIQSTSSIVNVSVPVPMTTTLMNVAKLTNGFRFTFTNGINAVFGVLMTTDLSPGPKTWTVLGGVTETSPGNFQFTDVQATNDVQRFYQLYAP
jgi:hypothetical protein